MSDKVFNKYVQGLLLKAGFSPGSVDGKKGTKTTSAIMLFQRKAGLKQTGLMDPATLTALKSGSVSAVPTPRQRPTLAGPNSGPPDNVGNPVPPEMMGRMPPSATPTLDAAAAPPPGMVPPPASFSGWDQMDQSMPNLGPDLFLAAKNKAGALKYGQNQMVQGMMSAPLPGGAPPPAPSPMSSPSPGPAPMSGPRDFSAADPYQPTQAPDMPSLLGSFAADPGGLAPSNDVTTVIKRILLDKAIPNAAKAALLRQLGGAPAQAGF